MPSTGPPSSTDERPPRRCLWRDPDFLNIWTAQSTFNLGRMMMVAPLVTILILDARPYQMAILGGATTTAGLLFGLITGSWIDRSKRRIILVISDLGSAPTLASVAVAHFLFEPHNELKLSVELWQDHYDEMTEEDKSLMPLREILFLSPER